MGAVLSFTTTLESVVCPTCGVQFGVPQHLLNSLQQSKAAFFCPGGHSQSYRESEADRLKRELASALKVAAQARVEADNARCRADNAEGARATAEKKLARIKNGVCPCCKRSFVALQRHMKTKHPEFKPRGGK